MALTTLQLPSLTCSRRHRRRQLQASVPATEAYHLRSISPMIKLMIQACILCLQDQAPHHGLLVLVTRARLKADLKQSVGMGNTNKMKDTLMFIIYADSTGKNVTVSPRLSYGNVEPSYTSNVTYTVAPGSGISNGTMTAIVQCHNCRSWKGGSVDPTNTAAGFLFASGPRESLDSNSVTANLQRHSSYGTFTIDLTQAVGAGQFPSVVTTNTPGTIQDTDKSDNDFLPALHGALMIIAFFGLMPIGLLILRVMNNVKWHALNQSLSAIVALIGLFVGIYLGTLYNRVCRLFSHRPSSLTSFTVAKLQLCPSSIRHSYCSCNGGPIPPWVYTPSNLQEDVGSYKTCAFSYLAWPSCYPRWCSKWIPVSLRGTILSKIKWLTTQQWLPSRLEFQI
jgi:hypothetical protein